ncbi:acyltransferase domain-containing protein, partial [Streptomyces sp. NPDC056749]|uniref:acyltransferase domain-containing protein n=1 Tax=Streptomyces sp. NPDC056749 TaxID=3345936 RepID=UPI0036901D87
MGRQLWDAEPAFAAKMTECEGALAPYVDWSLSRVVRGDTDASWWERVDVVQPVSFAVMVSLAALWQAYGVAPDAVLGHSQGEIAAACVAGALSLTDAAKIVALRSRVIAEGLAERGGMLSVAANDVRVRADIEEVENWRGQAEIAAVNGPASVVIAAEPGILNSIEEFYREQGVSTRVIPVNYASHSAHVELVRQQIIDQIGEIESRTPVIPWHSTLDVGWISAPVDAEYWYRNLRNQVKFAQAARSLIGEGFATFIECSSHPVLTPAVAEIFDEMKVSHGFAGGTLRRDDGNRERFLHALAEVFVRGGGVDWGAVVSSVGAGVSGGAVV